MNPSNGVRIRAYRKSYVNKYRDSASPSPCPVLGTAAALRRRAASSSCAVI